MDLPIVEKLLKGRVKDGLQGLRLGFAISIKEDFSMQWLPHPWSAVCWIAGLLVVLHYQSRVGRGGPLSLGGPQT